MSKQIRARGDLSADELRGMLRYDTDKGIFIWTKDRWKARAGARADTSSKHGYRAVTIQYHRYPAHRLAWLYVHGVWPKADIDHINGEPSDNRLCNLREATRTQNLGNSKLYKSSQSGFKGVSRNKKKFASYISISGNGRRTYLGYFDTAEEAHSAYCEAAQKHFGQFARTA